MELSWLCIHIYLHTSDGLIGNDGVQKQNKIYYMTFLLYHMGMTSLFCCNSGQFLDISEIFCFYQSFIEYCIRQNNSCNPCYKILFDWFWIKEKDSLDVSQTYTVNIINICSPLPKAIPWDATRGIEGIGFRIASTSFRPPIIVIGYNCTSPCILL